jgi:hypothetical protein
LEQNKKKSKSAKKHSQPRNNKNPQHGDSRYTKNMKSQRIHLDSEDLKFAICKWCDIEDPNNVELFFPENTETGLIEVDIVKISH